MWRLLGVGDPMGGTQKTFEPEKGRGQRGGGGRDSIRRERWNPPNVRCHRVLVDILLPPTIGNGAVGSE